jgi:hypothetical protein
MKGNHMPKFNKRHYEAIADAFHDANLECQNTDERMGVRLAYYAMRDAFIADNPAFKSERFLARAFGKRTNDNHNDRM